MRRFFTLAVLYISFASSTSVFAQQAGDHIILPQAEDGGYLESATGFAWNLWDLSEAQRAMAQANLLLYVPGNWHTVENGTYECYHIVMGIEVVDASDTYYKNKDWDSNAAVWILFKDPFHEIWSEGDIIRFTPDMGQPYEFTWDPLSDSISVDQTNTVDLMINVGG